MNFWPRFAGVGFILLGSSAASAATTHAQSVEDEVRRVALEMPRAIDYVEFDTFMDLFADDAIIYFPFAPTRVEGRAEIERSVRPLFERNRGREVPLQGFEPTDVRVYILGNDGAVVSWIMDRATDTARRSAVLRRQDGEWKIVLVHADNWTK